VYLFPSLFVPLVYHIPGCLSIGKMHNCLAIFLCRITIHGN
jgi:hypothetical protein